MSVGVGFANEEHEKTLMDYYREELYDAPLCAGGFVKDICYERAVERYNADRKKKPEIREQGLI